VGQTRRGRSPRAIAVASTVAAVAIGLSVATATASEFTGKTSLDVTLTGNAAADFSFLAAAPGEPYLVRTDLAAPLAGRETRRTSIDFLGQLSDFQLADEESPARVEFFDEQGTSSFSNAGHRPQETLIPHEIEASVREMNQFAGGSAVAQGNGVHAPMDQVLLTGDLADSNGKLEASWVKTLIEGSGAGTLDPNSGQNAALSEDPFCAALGAVDNTLPAGFKIFDDPTKYTGVQDYNDYVESNLFYDPNPGKQAGNFATWPSYPNLVDQAQVPFAAQGLNVPSYITPGNHDVLVQGNLTANASFEKVALGCVKPMGPFPGAFDPASIQAVLNPTYLQGLLSSQPNKVALVPPDNRRSYLSKAQYRQLFAGQVSSNGHGFGYVDPAELAASNGSALYYSFSPKPGLRFISLDTNSSTAAALVDPVGGSDASNGNIDDPQFQWLKHQLDLAQAANELVITYSHHGSSSMTFSLPDEGGNTPCSVDDSHGHDVNPGCDKDPRSSQPIHLGADFVNLMCQYPNVIAEVAGHSHENRIDAHPCASHDGFWEIKSPAIADWPTESRLIDVMDNHDGTLSIFGTMLNHEGAAASAPGDTDATGLGVEALASLGRTIAFNDNQAGGASSAYGQPWDRNVELLLDDPRDNPPTGGGGGSNTNPGSVYQGKSDGACLTAQRGGRRADRLVGTPGGDRIAGRRGRDKIRGLAGDDCLKGQRGRDRIKGGLGADIIKGGMASDRIKSRDGEVDRISCGGGRHDRLVADPVDVVLGGCESVRRR
jgi:hypothetical protein